mmetsp:Transcript_6008/g.18025  ORF Transcript_6008/g.18025 Transcript_6008/m.18025 type:complete len:998 (-) Transcript_6008:329-3322(-)
MVDFNESEGESAFLVVRSTKGVWFDNPHVFHRSLAKVPISFCFAEGAQVQTKVGGYFASSAEYEEWYQRRRASLTLPPSLGAEACGVNNDVVVKEEAATDEAASEEAVVAEESATEEATIKSATAEVSASQEAPVAEAPVAEEAVAEEAAKEVEKPAKTVSNTPDPTDTTCYPGLPTPMAAGKSGPASARSGSGPGYVDGVEAAVRRLGESVSYQATPADGKKSPSPGVPTSGGIAPVAPKPLGAGAGAGLAEAEAAKEREHWEGRLKKAKAALDLIAEQREKWADLQSRRSGKCRRKAMRCRNNPKFGKAKGRRKSGKAKGRGRGSHRRPKPRGGPQTPPCKSPDRRREPQTTSGKAPFAAGTCGAGAGTCGAGGRAALKAAANCVQGGYTKAEGAFRWLLLVCMPAFGHCAAAVPSPTAVASAFSSAVASASSAFSSGVASAASSAFSPAVASKASSLVSCSPLLMPALVLILLAIACGASWPTAASGKGHRRRKEGTAGVCRTRIFFYFFCFVAMVVLCGVTYEASIARYTRGAMPGLLSVNRIVPESPGAAGKARRLVVTGLVGAGALRLGRVASLEPSAAQVRVAAAALLVGRAVASATIFTRHWQSTTLEDCHCTIHPLSMAHNRSKGPAVAVVSSESGEVDLATLGLASKMPLVLYMPTEAPLCRSMAMETCQTSSAAVAMHPSSLVPVTFAPTTLPLSTYFRPRYHDLLPRANAFISSPCRTQWMAGTVIDPGYATRGHWVHTLAKLFPVDIYSGSCGTRHPEDAIVLPTDRNYSMQGVRNGDILRDVTKVAVSSLYRFTLHIENKQAPGYMTEKFYETFQSRNLGIYLGPTDAYVHAPGGRKSYIDLHDFTNVNQLASYLHYLVQNEAAYDRYFLWKQDTPAHMEQGPFAHLFHESAFTGTGRSKEGIRAWEALGKFLSSESVRNGDSWGPQIDLRQLQARALDFRNHLRDHMGDDEYVQRQQRAQNLSWPCRLCKQMRKSHTRYDGA